MVIITILALLFFSVFSTVVMSYISMATPIGPWIAPTIALLGLLVFRSIHNQKITQSLALVVSAGSIGGIIATACGFSYPALFFLDPTLFTEWMQSPLYFASIMAGLCFSAASFGFIFANLFEKQFIDVQELPFPIAQLVYKMITAGTHIKKAYELMVGFAGTILFCILQNGSRYSQAIIPESFVVTPHYTWGLLQIPTMQFLLWPMLWAIGFVTGHVIAIPLVVGIVTKIVCIDPINIYYFSELSSVEFVFAFAGGMVVYGAIQGFWSLRKSMKNSFSWVQKHGVSFSWSGLAGSRAQNLLFQWDTIISLASVVLFFSYFNVSFLNQIFLLAGTFACSYQIAIIAGKIGLAPLGRFATFMMIPAMMLFHVDSAQIIFIATFVQIAGGVAADILFGRKIAQMANINHKKIVLFQWIGLVISCVVIGGIFWILINRFGLGSAELFAYKAQSRSLLINAKTCNMVVLLFGALFTMLLEHFKINAMLVLGGLLMPIDICIGLIFGGALTIFTKDRESWDPLWSGVFAANSIWMVFKAIF